MNLGKAIRTTRIECDIKQYVLAEAVGITGTYMSQIENGKRHPSHELMLRFAAILKVSVGFLYFRAIDRNDFPKNKQDLFDALYPTIHNIAIQLI